MSSSIYFITQIKVLQESAQYYICLMELKSIKLNKTSGLHFATFVVHSNMHTYNANYADVLYFMENFTLLRSIGDSTVHSVNSHY